MWFLNFIPDAWLHWFVHGVVILGLILTLGGALFSRIPFIETYGKLFTPLGVLILCVGVFFEGGYGVEMLYRARIAEMEKKIAESEAKSAEANKNLSLALITRKAEIEASQKFIKDQISKFSKEIDADCKVHPKALDIINQAAKKPGVKK